MSGKGKALSERKESITFLLFFGRQIAPSKHDKGYQGSD